jgi:hypothetical protein
MERAAAMNTKQRYRLRLTSPYAFYDTEKSQLWWERPTGAIVTDKNEIEFLEARGAPVERSEA